MRDGMVKVSVLMPARDSARTLRRAIDSVLAQDYRAFELIVVDDGSRDETRCILASYRGNPRVRVYRHAKPRGETLTRIRLMNLARGRYLSLCDSDDMLPPWNLKTLSRALDENRDAGLAYGDYLVLEENPRAGVARAEIMRGRDAETYWDLVSNRVMSGGSMIRKDAYEDCGGYDPLFRHVCDNDLWFRLAEVSRLHYVEGTVTYLYFRHARSVSRSRAFLRGRNAEYLRLVRDTIARRHGAGALGAAFW